MESRHKIVRFILNCAGVCFVYKIGTIVRKQMILEQARIIQEQQIRYGGDFQLSDQKKRVLEQAQEYLDNHTGYRYLNRMRTQELFEQQFRKKIDEKEDALAKLSPEEKDKQQKLKSQIEQLQRAFKATAPKMPTSWEDLRQKDQDDQ